ncbi:MAG TPA: hypothetical protein PKK43_11730, partial [Spirochaetota bacterium]|nr:hypothetical protein [Spirochaetota bacterium]
LPTIPRFHEFCSGSAKCQFPFSESEKIIIDDKTTQTKWVVYGILKKPFSKAHTKLFELPGGIDL